jgi:Na+/melibiose symporter-like transporter
MAKHPRSLGLNLKGPVQRAFIVLEFTLLMFTMIYLLYLIFGTMEGVAAAASETEQAALTAVIDRINFLLLVRISILFSVVFVINVVLGLFYLHRLTGPLVRIKAVLDTIAGGELPEHVITLRKGDFPTDVTESLTNALLQMRRWKYPERH